MLADNDEGVPVESTLTDQIHFAWIPVFRMRKFNLVLISVFVLSSYCVIRNPSDSLTPAQACHLWETYIDNEGRSSTVFDDMLEGFNRLFKRLKLYVNEAGDDSAGQSDDLRKTPIYRWGVKAYVLGMLGVPPKCSWCMRTLPGKTTRCKACRGPAYCDRQCQRGHWSNGHKTECQKGGRLNSTQAELDVCGETVERAKRFCRLALGRISE